MTLESLIAQGWKPGRALLSPYFGRHPLAENWQLGLSLPLVYHSPLATGLNGFPRLIAPDNWVVAMAREVDNNGMVTVMERFRQAFAITEGVLRGQVVVADSITEMMKNAAGPLVRAGRLTGQVRRPREESAAFWKAALAVASRGLAQTGDIAVARQQLEQWTRVQVEYAAGLAAYGLKKRGRGAVVVDLRQVYAPLNNLDNPGYGVFYLSQRDLTARDPYSDHPAATQLHTYNPSREYIVLGIYRTLFDDMDFLYVSVTPPEPPEACFQRQREAVLSHWSELPGDALVLDFRSR